MKRFALFVLLGALILVGARAGWAAYPAPAPAAHPPTPGRPAYPLEGGPAQPGAPPFTTQPAPPVAQDPHWRANVRANTDTTTYAQQEPAIAVNPLNPLNIVAAQKDERRAPFPGSETKEVWIDTSTDGGLTWPVNVPIPMPDNTLPQQSDPVITFGDNNNVWVTIIGYTQNNPTTANLTMIARSTDGGLTWPTPVVRLNAGQGGSDKEWTAIDLNPASPYYHRMYITWTNFAAGPEFIEKWSSDSGVTWNPPGTAYVTVSFGAYDNGQFSMPVVLPNGTVLATWNDFGGHLVVGRSTDGGQSFISPNNVAGMIFNVNSVPGAAWRLNTIPSTAASPATGTVVTTWADGRNGKDDIYFMRSTDNGLTWTPPARLAHNTAGGSYQIEPWVSVAPNGRFDAIWYDDRDFPGAPNTFHVYATHSTDDGVTWTGPDEQVTDAATDLNIGIPSGPGWNGAAGDYINVTSLNNVAYAIWTDTRSGTNEDVYTSAYTPAQGTPTPTLTGTPPTATPTRTGVPTATATGITAPTFTATLPAASPTASATSTPTACTIQFTDVDQNNPFYAYIRCLACRGIVSGYADGSFRWGNQVTRGQLAKIIAGAAGYSDAIPSGQQTFEDVPASNTFWLFAERLAGHGAISGYACGGTGEPCVPPGNRPYFRWTANATRGQIAKIDAIAAGIPDPIPTTRQTFEDVPTSNPFWLWIEQLSGRSVISGYTCGGPGEPCVPPGNRPYFRWGADATRGQMAKIAAQTFFPNCSTPAR